MADQPSEASKTKWRRRLGLAPSTPDPEEWVRVASGRIDDPETGFSARADVALQILADAGIETETRPYVLPDNNPMQYVNIGSVLDAADRVGIAVLIHRRDLEQARDLLRADLPADDGPDSISDEELARLSDEAGREAGDGSAG